MRNSSQGRAAAARLPQRGRCPDAAALRGQPGGRPAGCPAMRRRAARAVSLPCGGRARGGRVRWRHGAFDNSPPLGIGERGDAVRLVQEGLVADGLPLPRSTGPDGRLDGVFGGETDGAVRRFQTSHAADGLTGANGFADGRVGRKTMGKLDELAGSGPPGTDLPECPVLESGALALAGGPSPGVLGAPLIPGLTCNPSPRLRRSPKRCARTSRAAASGFRSNRSCSRLSATMPSRAGRHWCARSAARRDEPGMSGSLPGARPGSSTAVTRSAARTIPKLRWASCRPCREPPTFGATDVPVGTSS